MTIPLTTRLRWSDESGSDTARIRRGLETFMMTRNYDECWTKRWRLKVNFRQEERDASSSLSSVRELEWGKSEMSPKLTNHWSRENTTSKIRHHGQKCAPEMMDNSKQSFLGHLDPVSIPMNTASLLENALAVELWPLAINHPGNPLNIRKQTANQVVTGIYWKRCTGFVEDSFPSLNLSLH